MTLPTTMAEVEAHQRKVAQWRQPHGPQLHADPTTGLAFGQKPVIRTSRPEYIPQRARRKSMNKLETAFAQELEGQRIAGQLLWFEFESQKFQLADGAWYTPDFPALRADGRQVVFEVKGFWREAARLRCKVMATRFPHIEVIAVTRNRRRQWVYERFHPLSPEPINAGAVPRGTSEGESQ
jgi:hypothetical protein